MQNKNGGSKSGRAAKTALTTISPTRATALVFVLSVTLPIAWGLTAGKATAQEKPEYIPAAPETAVELLAMAANAPARGGSRRRAPEPPPPVAPAPVRRQPAEPAAAPSEFYSREERGSTQGDAAETVAADQVPAAPAKPPAAALEPVTIAQAPAPISAAALLQQSAKAPQLSAVGAATSNYALSATTTMRSAAVRDAVINEPRRTRTPLPAPVTRGGISAVRAAAAMNVSQAPAPAQVPTTQAPRATATTQRTIAAAREAQAEAQSGGGAGQTTRRRAAMHRVAAAAASSLNDATPFRTSGSGTARFMSSSSPTESLGGGLDRAAEAISVVPGLRLENVSLSAGYSSNGLPGTGASLNPRIGLGADADFTGKMTLAFRKRLRSSSFGLTYTPSRHQRVEFTEWNSTDHVLGLTYDRQLGRRWDFGASASAANTGLEQFWFRQPVFRRVENPPTSLEELIQRVEAGEFTDEEFASLLTGSPIVVDPGGLELDIARVSSINTRVSASYAYSPRLTFTMGLGASYYTASESANQDATRRIAISDISRQFGYFQGAYRTSPSVTTGFRYNITRNDSTFGLSQTNSASAFVRKRFNRFWSAEGEGGGGYVSLDPNEGLLAQLGRDFKPRPTWIAGGSVDYRYSGHSFETFVRRQVGDNLGLTSQNSLSAGLAWEWATPRFPWVFNGGASYSRSELGYAFGDGTLSFYETSLLQGGLSRRLTPTTMFATGYYYGRYSSPFSGLLTGSRIHRVQATFLWRPVEPQ